jgi:hypothetical protein
MQWYYSKQSTQLGPVSLDELRAKLASGEVSGSDMVWREGLPDWRPASSMPELLVSVATPPVVPVTGGVVNSPYSPPVAAPAQFPGMNIPNYLWQSIVVTILCCWPLGIPAIVYAAKVDGLKARGDINGAMSASASAKMWCMIAVGSWLAIIVVYVIFAVLAFTFSQSQVHH